MPHSMSHMGASKSGAWLILSDLVVLLGITSPQHGPHNAPCSASHSCDALPSLGALAPLLLLVTTIDAKQHLRANLNAKAIVCPVIWLFVVWGFSCRTVKSTLFTMQFAMWPAGSIKISILELPVQSCVYFFHKPLSRVERETGNVCNWVATGI